jgi:very-short-patch-repair endonuclease
VVFDRLNKGGLGDLVLNLHGGDMRGKKLADQLYRGLEVLRSPATEPGNHTLGEWERVRKELVDHVQILHTPWEPWNLSPYACMDWLMGHPEVPHPGLRMQSSSLEQVSPELKRQMMELVDEYAALRGRLKSPVAISWKNAVADPGEKTLSLLDTLQDIAGHIRTLRTWYEENRSKLNLEVLEHRTQLQKDNEQLRQLESILPLYQPEALRKNVSDEISVLESYKGKCLKQFAGGLFSSSYRQAVRRVKGLFTHSVDLFTTGLPTLEKLRAVQEHWKGNPPNQVLNLDILSKEGNALEESLKTVVVIIPQMAKLDVLEELESVIAGLLEQRDNAYLIPKLLQLQKELSSTGMDSFILQCEQAGIPGEKWSSSFEQLYYGSILGIMKSRDMRIAAFDGRRQDEKRMLFRELDKKRQTLAVSRIRRLHAERMTGLMNRFPDQENVLRSQSQRKHPWPFKRIFREAPDVLLSVFPCWMASPLTVTQFLSADNSPFDVVFFDEASQVQPADAISSILRGRQLVVSGDTRQLPPTSFFADGEERSEEDEQTPQPSTSGYESLLHLLLGTLPGLGPAGDGWFLQWHYRSRDESLIAFSNEHIYNGRMVTFPRPSTEQAVHFVLVDPAVNSDVGQESSTNEVVKVAGLAIEMARKHPDKSLGIIALGIEHALRLEEAIEKAAENLDEESRSFFSESRKEPFFVKNLERVQGDERDIIILSIGYGQNRSGTLSHNFGPINQEGGERRLNVAITRSREQMWVVASFDPAELNPERTKGLGPDLLRKYLMYAKSGGRNLGQERPTGTEENFFERDIREALQSKGLQITSQYGVSGYRIDLVVHHPDKPGEFIMAIECDGAAYHSAPCARDRDRLRQEFLEGMGWDFHRIWSTDWFTRREEEIERALHRYRILLEESKTDKKTKSGTLIQPKTPVYPIKADEKKKDNRPPIPQYDSIQDYHDSELFQLAQWIISDGMLRTDQVLFEELFDQLGFRRKGTNITQRLNDIIQRMKG